MSDFEWVSFYTEFADKLVPFAKNRGALVDIIKRVYQTIDIKLPTLEKDSNVRDVDPFTVFGLFNKNITSANRIKIITAFSEELSIKARIPSSFEGVPLLNPLNATFYYFKGERGEYDIDHLWEVFLAALSYADEPNDKNRESFINSFDEVLTQKGIRWNITMGLFWIRPLSFINMDSLNRDFAGNAQCTSVAMASLFHNMSKVPTGTTYLSICEECLHLISTGKYEFINFPELSYCAFRYKPGTEEDGIQCAWFVGASGKTEDGVYTDYADEFIEKGIWRNGWDDKFIDMVNAIKAGDRIVIKAAYTRKNDLPFNNNGKTVGCMKIKAIGVVTKNLYDGKNIKVTWEKVEPAKVWYGQGALRETIHLVSGDMGALQKSLLKFVFADQPQDYGECEKQYAAVSEDIVEEDNAFAWKIEGPKNAQADKTQECKYTPEEQIEIGRLIYTGELSRFEAAREYGIRLSTAREYTRMYREHYHQGPKPWEKKEEEPDFSLLNMYTPDRFLSEVFMTKEKYEQLVAVLRRKKNIILQGAPGVGKTFAAKRLAYSMLGAKADDHIALVQFHQNYTYEDFMMGYKPVENGFELKKGIFYTFCEKARSSPNHQYFFIIDEINRGNMSKIFGELLMLIENDYRGTETALAYTGEPFSVPENLYIIGMMNTADRSLALIDYALRRRFSFVELEPGFDSDGFKTYAASLNNAKFDTLVEYIRQLNQEIAADKSLGKGFCIGHSYFCNLEKCSDEWLRSVIEYDILPMLAEYWFDDPGKINRWENILRGVLQ